MRTLTREQVDAVFEKAETQSEYLEEMYKLVYGDEWDYIEKVHTYPVAGEALATYIMKKAMEFDEAHYKDVFPGGLWLSAGFSTNQQMNPWGITQGEVSHTEEFWEKREEICSSSKQTPTATDAEKR